MGSSRALCSLFENARFIPGDQVVYSFESELDLGEMEKTNVYPDECEKVPKPVNVLIVCSPMYARQVLFVEIVQLEPVCFHVTREHVPVEVQEVEGLEPRGKGLRSRQRLHVEEGSIMHGQGLGKTDSLLESGLCLTRKTKHEIAIHQDTDLPREKSVLDDDPQVDVFPILS
jgi:hypothetical protein